MPFNFDDVEQRWREILLVGGLIAINQQTSGTSQGQLVPETAVIEEMRVHQLSTFDVLQMLTNQLYSGGISIPEWQIGVASELKDGHLAQSMFAVGGRANMTSVEFGRVGGTLSSEYRHLNAFAEGIANGTVSEAQALARVNQYGRATQQSYWSERTLIMANRGRMVNWVLHPAEHCEASLGFLGCVDLAADSPHDPNELTVFPGSGDTTCRGNCNCTLEEA